MPRNPLKIVARLYGLSAIIREYVALEGSSTKLAVRVVEGMRARPGIEKPPTADSLRRKMDRWISTPTGIKEEEVRLWMEILGRDPKEIPGLINMATVLTLENLAEVGADMRRRMRNGLPTTPRVDVPPEPNEVTMERPAEDASPVDQGPSMDPQVFGVLRKHDGTLWKTYRMDGTIKQHSPNFDVKGGLSE